MDAGVVIGGGSILFTTVLWAIERRDRKAQSAQERADRLAQFEEERKRQDALLDLDQRRLAMEVAQQEANQRAEITAIQGGFHPEGNNRAYEFTIQNMGPSYAKHVKAWLADQNENGVSNTALVGPLDVGGQKSVVLNVSLDALRRSEIEKLVLWTSWYGSDQQPHQEPSNLQVKIDG